MIAPGDVLHNRYRIERSIGRGGMGEVFAAVVLLPPPGREREEEVTLVQPTPQSSRVAIKVVSRAVIDEAAMARLEREAVAASRIKSDFVPELVEVGTTPEGEVFLAMDILYGDTLAARLKERRCLPWTLVFHIGDDVLSGLIDAHAAGVIHRDLKPSNIFLCEPEKAGGSERAKVLDFGVCKLDSHDEERLTATGESVGTVAYMAPEQIRGASRVTASADLYSFATVVFEALSGRLPHAAPGQMAMLASKLERSAGRLADSALVPVPIGLGSLLERLLSRDPSQRHPTARDVRDAWRALGPAVAMPRPLAGGVPAEASSPPTEAGFTSGAVDVAGPRGSRFGVALAAVAVALSSVVVLVLLATRHDAKGTATDETAAGREAERESAVPVPEVAVVQLPLVRPDPAPDVADEVALDAGEISSDGGLPKPRATNPRPPRAPWRSPPSTRSTPTKPHITDKPRY